MDKRLAYLEQANFHKMMALDLSKELGEFNSSISQLEDPDKIFLNCKDRAAQIIGFKQTAFFLVNEEDSSFDLYRSYPDNEDTTTLEKEIDILIEDGTFSRAIMEKGPVTAYSEDFDQQLFLHVIATVSRVRGMFVGVLEKKTKHIQEAAFELFTILMAHCANTLESFELYQRLKESHAELEIKVEQLSLSESCLKDEILEHKKTEAALEASERQYRLLAETAKEMIFILSKDKIITYANSSALMTSEYEKDEIIGLSISELLSDFELAIGEERESDDPMLPVDIKTKSGQMIPLELNLALIPQKGSAPGYLLVGRDISSRLKAEKDRKILETKLWQSQKMESIGLLASGIAHDFNNILSVICNYTTLSLAMTKNDEVVSEQLQIVQKASDRAVKLARKLYTIGRKDDHKRVEVNIVSVVKDTIDLVKSSLGKNIGVKTQYESPAMNIWAEETRIQQVLMNLVTNAGHALSSREGTIDISVSRVHLESVTTVSLMDILPGDYIKLTIRDDGPGIDPKITQRIFEPYFSTKTGKDNSGLGLAVVHGIVKNYRGGIDMETELGQGTCFHIYLPEYSQ